MQWGLIRCRMKRKIVCVQVWSVYLKSCAFVCPRRNVGGGNVREEGGKGFCACIIYLQVFFLLVFISYGFCFPIIFSTSNRSCHTFTSFTHPVILSPPSPCFQCLLSMRKWGFQLSLGISFALFKNIFCRRFRYERVGSGARGGGS